MSDSLQPCGPSSSRLLYPWDSQGKNIGVGCHALLQEIFLTQGSNLHLLHWKGILYHQATREACACMLSHFSHVRFFVTLWTVAHQAPLSMGFFRQEYWSGLPSSPPGDLLNPRIEPKSLMSPALAGGFFGTE